MRTTLSIDDDILAAAKNIASTRSKSVGSVISELARKGMSSFSKPVKSKGIPTFKVSKNARILTLEDVKLAEDEI